MTVSSLCYFINLPLVPLILQERDPSRLSAVGVLVSAAFIVAAVMSPVWGWLADRYDPKSVMQLTAVLAGGSSLLMAWAPTFEMMLVARLLNGFAAGLITSAYTFVVSRIDAKQQGAALGSLSAGRAAGAVVGPATAALAAVTSSGTVLYGAAALSLVTALFATFLPRSSAAVTGGDRQSDSSVRSDGRAERRRSWSAGLVGPGIALAMSIFVYSAISTALSTAIPLRLVQLSSSSGYLASGMMFAIAGAITLLLGRPWGAAIDSIGLRRSLLVVTSAVAIALVLLAVAAPSSASWPLFATYALFNAVLTPMSTLTSLVNAALTSSSGIGQGVQNSLFQMGSALGPLITGATLPQLELVFVVCAVAGVGAGLLLLVSAATGRARP